MDHQRNQLKQAAIEIANDLRQRGLDLKRQLQETEFRVLEIKTALDSSNLAIDRLKGFQPTSAGISNVRIAGFRVALMSP